MAGLVKSTGYQQSAPYSTLDCRNVRPREALTGRQRGSSRPGLRRAYATRIGSSGYKIRLLNTMIPQTTALGGTYGEDFTDNPAVTSITGRGWVHGSWITFGAYISNYAAGYGSGTEGYLQLSPAPASTTPGTDEVAFSRVLPTDFLATANWSFTAYVRAFAGDLAGAGTLSFKLYFLMDNTTPNPTTGGTTFTVSYGINVAQTTFAWTVSCAGVGTPSVASGTVSSGVGPQGDSLGFTANYNYSAGTLKIYFAGTLLTTITGVAAPTGNRFGFGLKRDTTVSGAGLLYGFGVDKLGFQYTPVSTGLTRVARSVASADGAIWYEDSSAEMQPLSASPTISSTFLVHSVERAGKLYIADHGDIRKVGSASGFTSGGAAPRVFDDAGVVWNTLGIDVNSDVLYISAGTNVTAGNYRIASIAGDGSTITLQDDPGATGSSISYQIRRAPKIFDYDAQSLTVWHQPSISTKGFIPLGCPFIARFLDCIILAGEPSASHVWYMSRQGDPLDFYYGGLPGDFQRAIAGSTSEAGVMSDQMTALVPYQQDYLLFGFRNSMWVLRGHPAQGGRIDNISRIIGILDRAAWCHGPSGEVVFVSRSGLYVLSGMQLIPISEKSIPVDFLNIDTANITVLMQYDVRDKGIHIFLTNSTAGTPTTHFWMEWETKTIWPVGLYDDHRPFSVASHFLSRVGENTTLLGGSDGYIRYFDRAAGDDDAQTLSTYVWIGPIKLGTGARTEGLLQELDGILSDTSGDITWEVFVGKTPETALTSAVLHTGTWSAGVNTRNHPRARGAAMFIKLSSSSGSRWSLESAVAKIRDAGKFRMP